jgi:hypothetical protein
MRRHDRSVPAGRGSASSRHVASCHGHFRGRMRFTPLERFDGALNFLLAKPL